MDRNSKIAKNVPKMFQDSRCLTETPRFLDEIPRFPINRNSKISEIPKPILDSESAPIFPLVPRAITKYPTSLHQEKVLHVDMRFFLNMHVEKKSHVNMEKSHVNMRFFPNMHVEKNIACQHGAQI